MTRFIRRQSVYSTTSRFAGRRFALVERLVMVAVVGVLIVLLLPTFQASRQVARRPQPVNRLRQQALGMFPYGPCESRVQAGTARHHVAPRPARLHR